jgi:hypothetical protein
MIEIACIRCQKRGWHNLYAGPLTEDLVHAPVDAAGCQCCTVSHDHTGFGCRPVAITLLPGTMTMIGAL